MFHATQAIDQRGFAIVGKLRGSLLRVGALTGAAMTDAQHALRTWKTRFRAKWSHSWSSSVRVSRSPRVGSGGGTVMALKWMAMLVMDRVRVPSARATDSWRDTRRLRHYVGERLAVCAHGRSDDRQGAD
ncbi:hypothetical protein [Burkholderia savannae]|uniref:hypothetical protein n=1 Tax=Burkholderia savannae TaxID=1637837 RepID=UPI000AAF94E9|nr:hypothetical protein [Burkholderia savannae]